MQTAAHVVQTLDILHRRWNTDSMLVTRRYACEMWQKNPAKLSQSMLQVAEYFEHMGVLVREQHIKNKVIWDMYSWYIEAYYAMFKDLIEKARVNLKDKTAFTEFEALRNAMRQISLKAGVPDFELSSGELQSFVHTEIETAKSLLELYRIAGQETQPISSTSQS